MDGDHQHVWDYGSRLVEVKERQSGNWKTTGECKYDAHSRRTWVRRAITLRSALAGTPCEQYALTIL